MRNMYKISALLGALAFLACPAFGQQIVTVSGLRGGIETTARVPPPGAPAGETLTESRLRDRSLLQKRITILRNYMATTVLSARERLAVEKSVKELETKLGQIEVNVRGAAAGPDRLATRTMPASKETKSKMNFGTNPTFGRSGRAQDDEPAQDEEAAEDDQDDPATGPAGTKKEERRFFDKRTFSLSGGVVLSKLEKRAFQPVLGIARDINGTPTNGDTLTKVIGLEEDNDWTVGPILLLNTKFWERQDRNFGIHGSVGITAKREDATTEIDYFFGPSISFMRGLLFCSGGVYVGKQKRLAGDAFLGAELDDATTEVPVVKEYHAKPGFSLTFRIFPLPR